MSAAKPKTKEDTDLPEDIMDPEVAYYDALWPSRNTRDGKAEVRRAYAMDIASDIVCVLGGRDNIVTLAADIEAYLREGKVPGRGTKDAAVLVHAVTDKGEILR